MDRIFLNKPLIIFRIGTKGSRWLKLTAEAYREAVTNVDARREGIVDEVAVL